MLQQQHSIFEPLFSSFQLAPTMELMRMERQAPTPAEKAFLSSSHYDAPSHSWFTETPPPSTTNCIGIRRATGSSLPFLHPHAPIAVSSHLPIHIPKLSLPSRIHEQQSSSLDISLPRAHDDDGSVASKLLSSITKSISSPSLNLPSSKEVARETPYQKSLKLKHLKLQHCAEALGMESSDSSLSAAAGYNIICPSFEQKKLDMIENLSSWPSGVPPKISNQEYSLTSVKSAPNLSAPPMMMTSQRSKYMRCASFPPPLSHTLPASPSACDSLSLALRSYRQDGRLILKEVVVPSKNYFHANRSNGRLILRVLTRDSDEDEEESARQYHEQQGLISSDSCGFVDAIVEEESMISLDQTTQLEVVISHGNDIVCTNKTRPLVEEASAKASVHSIELFMSDATELPNIAAKVATMKRVCIAAHGGDQTLAKTSAASAANLLNLRRMQCIHIEPHGGQLHHLGDPATRSVKSNILSNVIALTLQISNHSRKLGTLQKAQVINSLQPSRYPLSSTRSMEQSTVIQPHGYERNLLASSHHDMSTPPESKENFIWESYLLPCVEVSSSKSMRRGDDDIESSFVLEELNVNSLIKMVSPRLATVGVTCDVGDWYTVANRRKPSREDNNETKVTDAMPCDVDASTIAAEAYNTLSSAMMGGGISGKLAPEDNIANHGNGIDPHCGFNHHDHDEEKVSIDGMNEAGEVEVAIPSTMYSTTSALPHPPTYNLQSDEWLHTLHCKELSDIRNQFGICSFMQPHSNCIATRS